MLAAGGHITEAKSLFTCWIHLPVLTAWPRESVPPSLWRWRITLSFKWKNLGGHINHYEVLAAFASLRWRARKGRIEPEKYLHLLDSQVSIAVLVKHRSASQVLRRVCTKHALTEIAAALHPTFAYIRSEDNPADLPARTLVKVSRRRPKGAPRP